MLLLLGGGRHQMTAVGFVVTRLSHSVLIAKLQEMTVLLVSKAKFKQENRHNRST